MLPCCSSARDQGDEFVLTKWSVTADERQPVRFGSEDPFALPLLQNYPTPHNAVKADPPEVQRRKLAEIYREFMLDLMQGAMFQQLTTNRARVQCHVQLVSDLQMLKLDQHTGRMTEFPLVNVSRLYRLIVRADMGALEEEPDEPEHLVVLEFPAWKLVFIFEAEREAQRFSTCMELLVHKTRQREQSTPTCFKGSQAWPVD